MLRSMARRLLPSFLLGGYRRLRRRLEAWRNSTKSIEQVFTEIYEQRAWGGAEGEYCSGAGSTSARTVTTYLAMVGEQADREGFRGTTFVDLGCGDFRVGRQLLPLCSNYVGVDVVEPLIRRNRERYGNEKTRFAHLDIVRDELPDGEVCFVRQVLQHLSNAQIAAVLAKLDKYRWVFVTEHQPSDDNPRSRPNLDKVHGGDVRVYEDSGVYLDEPPFDLPHRCLQEVLALPGRGLEDSADPGIIRTWLYRPSLR